MSNRTPYLIHPRRCVVMTTYSGVVDFFKDTPLVEGDEYTFWMHDDYLHGGLPFASAVRVCWKSRGVKPVDYIALNVVSGRVAMRLATLIASNFDGGMSSLREYDQWDRLNDTFHIATEA